MVEARAQLGANGRLVIPANIRHALGLKRGDEVLLLWDGQELRIVTPAQAVSRAQALIEKHLRKSGSLIDELIAERRLEAGDE